MLGVCSAQPWDATDNCAVVQQPRRNRLTGVGTNVLVNRVAVDKALTVRSQCCYLAPSTSAWNAFLCGSPASA
jgi:hypothetical protein